MHFHVFLHHLHFFCVVVWDVENGLDCNWHISRVMQFILIWDLGICQMLIKHLILILSHISLFSVPDCGQIIDEISIQVDWVFVEYGILLNNLLNLCLSCELNGIFSESQHNLRSSLKVKIRCLRNLIFSISTATPFDPWLSRCWPRIDLNIITDNKSWIESNSKLSNNALSSTAIGWLCILINEISELFGATLGNCTQVINDLLLAHSNSAIENG